MKHFKPLFLILIVLVSISCNTEPLEGDFPDEDENACINATQNSIEAATNFTNATSENYTELCNDYKTAVQAQIIACGDAVGALQQIIDSLGDCNTVDSCTNATTAAQIAETEFDNATDENFTQLCSAYKIVLQAKRDICGDQDGSIQTIIDGLGNCTNSTDAIIGVISVTTGTLNKTFEENITIETVGTLLKIRAEDDATTDWVSFEVEQNETGTDIIQNFIIHLVTKDYIPTSNATGTFTSTIDINSSTQLEGSFFGPVVSSDNADLSLTQGVIDLDIN